jgi:hypothetical protein
MNRFVWIVFVILVGAMLWLPYYILGGGAGNRFLSQGRILLNSLIARIAVLPGFVGLIIFNIS